MVNRNDRETICDWRLLRRYWCAIPSDWRFLRMVFREKKQGE